MHKMADTIVIGGGIIGAATACYLARKGADVLVLEKNAHIGDGGSSRNGGGVRQSGRDPRELPLAMYGIRNLWPSLSDELGIDVEYVQEGNLRLGKTPEHLRILQGLTERSVAAGLDVRMIDGAGAKEICPYLSEEVVGASWCPTDGHANPLMTTLGYYRKARQLGARFITGEKVLQLKKIKGRVRQVVTETGVYEGNNIIVAAGFESREILSSVGIDVPMTRITLEVLVTEAQPQMFGQMLGTAMADFYGHQSKHHGSFVFGGTSGFEHTNKDYGMPVTASISAPCICRGIIRYVPILEDVKIVRTWAGWADISVDGIPVISHVEEVPGLIAACGFTGHGFGIAPIVGLLLSQMASGENPVLDIKEFRYDRFKTKI